MTLIPSQHPATCRIAQSDADVAACQALRHACFLGTDGLDADIFDASSDHVMIEQNGALVCTMRLRVLGEGVDLSATYTGQYYAFDAIKAPALEIGRFCTSAGPFSLDVLRMAWAVLLAYVDQYRIATLFGCTSFQGIDPMRYSDAFATLNTHYISDIDVQPRGADGLPLSQFASPDARSAHSFPQLSALQISYLKMGGRVSDHLIVDHGLNTLHVFLCLAVADIPAARVASLRRMAAQTTGLHIPAPRNS